MNASRTNSKHLDIFRSMPPLQHWDRREPFALERSEVLRWIACQPTLLHRVMQLAANRKLIVFDRATGMWRGVQESHQDAPVEESAVATLPGSKPFPELEPRAGLPPGEAHPTPGRESFTPPHPPRG